MSDMGGLRWHGDRRDLDDHRGDPPAIWHGGDGVDGPRALNGVQPPAGLGPFTFPAPYHTRAIRLTNASIAPNGVEPRVYPYWSVINNHAGRSFLWVIVGRQGQAPALLRVDKSGGVTLERELPMGGTAEGWYFSDTQPDVFYFLEGASLRRFNVATGQAETVFTLDPKYGDDLWQAHSSSDDQTHSATVRRRTTEGAYPVLGAVAARQGAQHFTDAPGMDECQIDKSGRYLILQVTNENRIFDLELGGYGRIPDREGALAHLDVGEGFAIGEDDSGDRWQMSRWDLRRPGAPKTVLMIGPAAWGSGMGHLAVRGSIVLHSSNATGELWMLPADGSGPSTRIAPGLISGTDYDHQLRACLDPTGQYAAWVAELDGRPDLLLVELPGTSAPPIVVHPPDPKPPIPGGHPVPGSQPYPDEQSWWPAFEADVKAAYAEKDRPYPDPSDEQSLRWHGRTAYDIGAGMNAEQSKAKHLRELRSALGLGGPSVNP